jgi:hypothetical protein
MDVAAPGSPLRDRIMRERGRARVFASILSLPLFLMPAWMIFGAIYGSIQGANEDENPVVVAAMVLALVSPVIVLLTLVAVWTWRALFAFFTPPRAQVMWLRRFQSEGEGAFQVSRQVDRLARYGVGSLTLQDRDVTLSWEQRRSRMAPVFWVVFLPAAAGMVWLFMAVVEPALRQSMEDRMAEWSAQQAEAGPAAFLTSLIGGFFMVIVNVLVFVIVLMLSILAAVTGVLLTTVVAAWLSGPIGAMFGKKRDDFPGLPKLLERIGRGKRPRGATIIRIRDENWREAVRMGIEGVDAVIIDVSDVTDAIAWEICQALDRAGRKKIIFMAREGAHQPRLSPAAGSMVTEALGGPLDISGAIRYPAGRKAGGASVTAFARKLREAVYAAAPARGGAAGNV